MEAIYKCKYQSSEQISLDYLKWACYHSAPSIVLFVFVGIAAISVCGVYLNEVVKYVWWGAPFRVSPVLIEETVILALLLVYTFWLRHLIAVRRTKNRLNELYHGNFPVVEISFFEDRLCRGSNEEPITLYYSDIKRMYRWKNYLYLRTKSRMIHFLPAEGMENGTLEELTAFLRGKGIR